MLACSFFLLCIFVTFATTCKTHGSPCTTLQSKVSDPENSRIESHLIIGSAWHITIVTHQGEYLGENVPVSRNHS